MAQFNNDRRRDKLVSGGLFTGTFLVHLAWTAYVSNREGFEFIEKLQGFISSILYSGPGFEWKGIGAYVVTAALASSCATNVVRRFFEGIFLGWPRFKEHDRNSLIRASMLLIGYGAMIYFAIGFFGEKYSSRPLNTINIFLIAISTYIAGLLVDFVDEVISGFYCTYIGDKA
ncbi:MAG: hypothetical protein ACK5N7_13240 [Curvibacter sp.]|jgi:hypothetical protein